MEQTSGRALFEAIAARLAEPTGRVVITTYTRQTVYAPKHAGMFRASTQPTDLGVYVQRGKRWDYVLPQYITLARVAR